MFRNWQGDQKGWPRRNREDAADRPYGSNVSRQLFICIKNCFPQYCSSQNGNNMACATIYNTGNSGGTEDQTLMKIGIVWKKENDNHSVDQRWGFEYRARERGGQQCDWGGRQKYILLFATGKFYACTLHWLVWNEAIKGLASLWCLQAERHVYWGIYHIKWAQHVSTLEQ